MTEIILVRHGQTIWNESGKYQGHTEAKLRGKDYRSISLADIGKMAAAEANPRSSWRASREFRLRLLEQLVQQAFTTALQRAEGGDL